MVYLIPRDPFRLYVDYRYRARCERDWHHLPPAPLSVNVLAYVLLSKDSFFLRPGWKLAGAVNRAVFDMGDAAIAELVAVVIGHPKGV